MNVELFFNLQKAFAIKKQDRDVIYGGALGAQAPPILSSIFLK